MTSIWRRAGAKLGFLRDRAADPGGTPGQVKLYGKRSGLESQFYLQNGATVVNQLTPTTDYVNDLTLTFLTVSTVEIGLGAKAQLVATLRDGLGRPSLILPPMVSKKPPVIKR